MRQRTFDFLDAPAAGDAVECGGPEQPGRQQVIRLMSECIAAVARQSSAEQAGAAADMTHGEGEVEND